MPTKPPSKAARKSTPKSGAAKSTTRKTSAKAPAAKKPAAKAPAAKKPAAKKPAATRKAAPAKVTAAKKSTPARKTAKAVPAKAKSAAKPPAKTAAKAAPAKRAGTSAPAKAPAAPPVAKPAAKKAPTRKPVLDKFLLEQQALLLQERAEYLHQAEALKAEADQLAQDMEPGDIQFDEESGEGNTINVERERDLALSAQARVAADEIDRALAKIDAGTYGICERCGEPILRARLKALPYAALCVRCKSGGLSRR